MTDPGPTERENLKIRHWNERAALAGIDDPWLDPPMTATLVRRRQDRNVRFARIGDLTKKFGGGTKAPEQKAQTDSLNGFDDRMTCSSAPPVRERASRDAIGACTEQSDGCRTDRTPNGATSRSATDLKVAGVAQSLPGSCA
jgi:hypothetical protein